jgi:uncharacterized membrane protein
LNDDRERPLSTSEFFTTMLLLGIPVVNLVLLVAWAFGGSANLNRRNLSRAMLIFTLIAVVVWIVSFVLGLTVLSGNPGLRETLMDYMGTN